MHVKIIIVHTSCYCALDLLCVKILQLSSGIINITYSRQYSNVLSFGITRLRLLQERIENRLCTPLWFSVPLWPIFNTILFNDFQVQISSILSIDFQVQNMDVIFLFCHLIHLVSFVGVRNQCQLGPKNSVKYYSSGWTLS